VLGRHGDEEKEVTKHGAPPAMRTDSHMDGDLVVVAEVFNDIFTCEKRLVIRISLSIPHEIAPLLIRQMFRGWGRFDA